MAKLEQLKTKWNAVRPDFHQWFVSYDAELFCSSMIRSVRSSAGLGCPSRSYTTNNNESINRVLKDQVCYRKLEWPEFNSSWIKSNKKSTPKVSVVVHGEY